MNLETQIVVAYPAFVASDLYNRVQQLKSAFGSSVITEADFKRPDIIIRLRVTYQGQRMEASYVCSPVELLGLGVDGDLDEFATFIRADLASRIGNLIRDEVLNSLTPPPDFVDIGVTFRDSPLYFKTTGSREQDWIRTAQFHTFMHDARQTTLRDLVIVDLQ